MVHGGRLTIEFVMTTPLEVIDSLRRRFEANRVTCLRDAINAFEESYQQDRVECDDSLTIVGWPKSEAAVFDLALGRCIGGGPSEVPTIVTVALLIPFAAGDSFATEVDEDIKHMEWQQGHIFLQCKNRADADAYFAKVRNLAVVQKYGAIDHISCKVDVLSDDKKAEIR